MLAVLMLLLTLPNIPIGAFAKDDENKYGLWICDQVVNDENAADILEDGVFSYNKSTNMLTIDGDCTGMANTHNINNKPCIIIKKLPV